LSDWAAASLRFLLIGLHAGIPPTEYPTQSFFTEEISTVRHLVKVNFESELLLVIREDDPASPIENEIWLRRLP